MVVLCWINEIVGLKSYPGNKLTEGLDQPQKTATERDGPTGDSYAVFIHLRVRFDCLKEKRLHALIHPSIQSSPSFFSMKAHKQWLGTSLLLLME